jgi:hypothetical protein
VKRQQNTKKKIIFLLFSKCFLFYAKSIADKTINQKSDNMPFSPNKAMLFPNTGMLFPDNGHVIIAPSSNFRAENLEVSGKVLIFAAKIGIWYCPFAHSLTAKIAK